MARWKLLEARSPAPRVVYSIEVEQAPRGISASKYRTIPARFSLRSRVSYDCHEATLRYGQEAEIRGRQELTPVARPLPESRAPDARIQPPRSRASRGPHGAASCAAQVR